MPYALIIIGVLLIVTAYKNTYTAMGNLLYGDFTGPNNFLFWIGAIVAIGFIGYIKPLQPLSRAFLILVVIVMILKNGGFAQAFTDAIQQGPIAATPDPIAMPAAASSGGGSGSKGGGFDIGSAMSLAAMFL